MRLILSVVAIMLVSGTAYSVESGKQAPDFTAATTKGKTIRLSDYKDKIVVLEWTNAGCPFVKKHYDSKNMQSLQKKYTDRGVVWLSVVSSAPGKQGHADAKGLEDIRTKAVAVPTEIIIDDKGKLGRLYNAETTPHMYVIDSKGKLIYQGAIDDKPSADVEDIAGSKNYVADTLESLLAGKTVVPSQTKAYGCSVKY